MQVELLNRRRWRTRLELATAMFEYPEIFHNRHRRHSALGMQTPIEYEKLHHQSWARSARLLAPCVSTAPIAGVELCDSELRPATP